MKEMSPRKLNALVLLGIGILLMMSVEPVLGALPDAHPLIQAGVRLLALPGLVCFVLGVYRFATKGKES